MIHQLLSTVLIALAIALSTFAVDREDVLSQLTVSPSIIDPAKGENAVIGFRSKRQGRAVVRLYGPDWRQIRELDVENIEPGEPVRVRWDGTDDSGVPVPVEAYFPVVEFADHDGRIATLDPTTDARIGPVLLQGLRFDQASGSLEYTLDAPARVTIHAGIGYGGPLLTTLLSDLPRAAGVHREPWNGWDEAGVIDIAAQKGFRLFADGISLWPASIIVTGNQTQSYAGYRRADTTPRPVKQGPKLAEVGGMPSALPRPHDITPEPRFELSVIGSKDSNGSDVPVVSGKVRVQVALDESVRIPVIERRFEIVLFSNLEFVTEMEEGHSPATIIWDSTQVADGERLLTVNVATLPGQMSSASLRVRVENTP